MVDRFRSPLKCCVVSGRSAPFKTPGFCSGSLNYWPSKFETDSRHWDHDLGKRVGAKLIIKQRADDTTLLLKEKDMIWTTLPQYLKILKGVQV